MNIFCVVLISAVLMMPAVGFATEARPAVSNPPLMDSGLVMQMILGLILVLMLIAAGAWLMRRFMPLRGGQGALQILGGLTLGSRERVVLLQVGDTRLLLGVAPGRVQTLHVLNGGPGDGFAAELARAGQGNRHD